MRVIRCNSFGPLSDLELAEVDPPVCGAGSVRIAVTAAGVNFVDALFVQGRYQIKPPLPFVPGNEVAGTVAEIGEGVTGFRVGDRVLANVGLGGFASEVAVDARRVLHTPPSLSDGQAATFTQSYSTAWFALTRRAAARPGQSMLVLGAGSGVGLAAVDAGRALGLSVIAAASTDDKRRAATERGAVAVIDSSAEDVKSRAKELAAEHTGDSAGVDLVYDPVGGAQGESALRALRDDGQFLVIGFASGTIPQLPANQVLLRNRRVIGVDWGAWVGRHQRENTEMLAEIVAAIGRGELHPAEPVAYRLADAATALQDQLDRKITGKTVLVP